MIYDSSIITVSDKGFQGLREDISGKVIEEILLVNSFNVVQKSIVPDEIELISDKLIEFSKISSLILTTGGTGFSLRDVTPEATKNVIDREASGISEAIRANSLAITKRAMLSRAVSGIRGSTLIINLPGSPKAVKESLEFIIDTLKHGLDILLGNAGECAR